MRPECVNGLPGVMLSMSETSGGKFPTKGLHGPPGIAAFMQGTESFAWNRIFQVNEYTHSVEFSNLIDERH